MTAPAQANSTGLPEDTKLALSLTSTRMPANPVNFARPKLPNNTGLNCPGLNSTPGQNKNKAFSNLMYGVETLAVGGIGIYYSSLVQTCYASSTGAEVNCTPRVKKLFACFTYNKAKLG